MDETPIDILPIEILEFIFQIVDDVIFLYTIAPLVCQKWRRVAINIGNPIIMVDKACIYGYLDLIKYIDKHYNVKNRLKQIQAACKHGHLDVVKYLEHDSPYDKKHVYTSSVFVDVCSNGHLEVAQYVMKQMPNYGQTLHYIDLTAVFMDHIKSLEMCKWLFDTFLFYKMGHAARALFFEKCLELKHLPILEWWLEHYEPTENEIKRHIRRTYISCQPIATYLVRKYKIKNIGGVEEEIISTGSVDLLSWVLTMFPTKEIDWGKWFPKVCEQNLFSLALKIEYYYNLDQLEIDVQKCFAKVCGTGNLDFAEWFFRNFTNLDGINALQSCCDDKHVDVVEWLTIMFEFQREVFFERKHFHVFLRSCKGEYKLADWILNKFGFTKSDYEFCLRATGHDWLLKNYLISVGKRFDK